MTKKEKLSIADDLLNIYSGILFNNQNFENQINKPIKYDFDCIEYQELIEKYELDKIAGRGSSFNRAKRLLHYLAPKLKHSSWYDNHIECNALKLLEYSFGNDEQGINCLNKSKILEECCLALGIYARRVSIMPFSPYDFDNHVVCEIYDEGMGKWIMLDPTTDGLFVDINKTPLSLLEMREKFANNDFLTFVPSINRLSDLNKLKERYSEMNAYICKNLFYFKIGLECKFGVSKDYLTFVPVGYSLKKNTIANIKYRLNHILEEYKDMVPSLEKKLKNMNTYEEPKKVNIQVMLNLPIGN